MTFLKRFKLPVFAGFLFVGILFSCSEELTTIGAPVIGGEPFETGRVAYDVFAFNKKIEAVRTNKLPLYQLGNFDDPIYGKTSASITTQLRLGVNNPSFGIFSQSVEDNPNPESENQIQENETVDSVSLYIPFLTKTQLLRDTDGDGVDDEFDDDINDPNSDEDGDEVTDNQERINGTDPFDPDSNDPTVDGFIQNNFARMLDVDSIYGDRSQSFNFKVERSTFFLRDLDPNANFEEAQQYFSNQQFSPEFVSDVLFEGGVPISDKEILLRPLDDLETSDVNESETFEKLGPGIRVLLETDFFQQNIIDKEGSSELLTQANFAFFLRGLHLSTPLTDEIMMLLDLRNANITIHYTYKRFNTTTSEEEDRNSTYSLSLLTGSQSGLITGNAVNTLNNEDYPPEISDQMAVGPNIDDASRIYLKGGSGSYAEINLFDNANGREVINEIKANNWIVNEANLVFNVDKDAVNAVGGIIPPPRIYLYNAENGQLIFNPLRETSIAQTNFGLYQNFNGIIDEKDNGDIEYKIRITDHVNNMIIRDSTNATLGLTLTPDIRVTGVTNAMLSDSDRPEEEIPLINSVTPLGTVLFGTNVEAVNEDKKLKLEIFYTSTN